jgi:hypothetical protein
MAGQSSQAHLNALAQSQGFRDYNHWSTWNAQRQQMLSQNPTVGAPGEAGAPSQPAGNNWLQNLLARIPIHPSYLLGKVNDAFTQAGQ